MHPLFPLGKIVTADSQQHAIQLFQLRKKLGISGIIFNPEIEIPSWTAEEKTALGTRKIRIHPQSMQPVDESQLRDIWRLRAGDITFNLVELSKKFNQTGRTKQVWYVANDEIASGPHRDSIAKDVILHLHFEGRGMVCLSRTGDDPLLLKSTNAKGTYFDKDEIKALYALGKIQPIGLEPKQAIVFDETMIHLSQPGQRFRALTFNKR